MCIQKKWATSVSKVERKHDVTMLLTVHEAIFVETGHLDREGKKIEKPE